MWPSTTARLARAVGSSFDSRGSCPGRAWCTYRHKWDLTMEKHGVRGCTRGASWDFWWNVTSLVGLREHREETIGFRLQIWGVSCRYSMKPNPMIWWNQPQTAYVWFASKISLWPTFCGLFLHDLAWKMTTFAASNVGFGRAQRTDVPDIAAVSHLHSAPHLYENWCFSDPRHASTHRESQVFFCKCLIHFLTNRSIDIYSL